MNAVAPFARSGDEISIETQGRPYRVPAGVTAIQALWYAGETVIHGVGCLGGTCGACTITYRRKGELQPRIGLGCQTVVEDGFAFEFLQPVSAPKPRYRFPLSVAVLRGGRTPAGAWDPKADLLRHFPEAARCRVCRACTEACPQGIDVMGTVLRSAKGDFAPAADTFFNCVMCGACAVVCVGVADIRPHEVGLYARRAHGALALALECNAPANLVRRIEEIAGGAFEAEWTRHTATT